MEHLRHHSRCSHRGARTGAAWSPGKWEISNPVLGLPRQRREGWMHAPENLPGHRLCRSYYARANMKVKTLQIVWHGKEPVYSVDFAGPATLATAGADKEIKLWQVGHPATVIL